MLTIADNVDKSQKYQYAVELVMEIRLKINEECKDLTLLAAGYPGIDFAHLKTKIDAGVDAILTQLTFSAREFLKFVHDCRRNFIFVPIIPGLYIPRNPNELSSILNITKVSMPPDLQQMLKQASGDEEKFHEHGLLFISNLITEIRNSSPEYIRGFHFFTMNNLTLLSRLMTIVEFSDASLFISRNV
jgi:methylenetetrahydrofolate reductase (NADPH)